jgi:cytochrome c
MRLLILSGFALAALGAGAVTAEPLNIALGRNIFEAHCSLCHDNSKHMINDVGPALFGVVGRRVASVEGYDYSPALEAAGRDGKKWTEGRLDRFLSNPMTMHPGTDMPMNFDRPEDRKAIIAYLKTLK